MTIELWMLLASALLMLAMPPVYGQGYIRTHGLATMAGNRENVPAAEGWFSRAKRAHGNLGENLIPFAAVVLVADAADIHSIWTRAGAVVFVVARLAHAASYTAGFVPTRAPAYLAGIAGTLMIAGAVLATLG